MEGPDTHISAVGLPRMGSLWSRKDTRRPGIVRVEDTLGPLDDELHGRAVLSGLLDDALILVASVDTGRTSEVAVRNFTRRYRPFVGEGGSTQAPGDAEDKA